MGLFISSRIPRHFRGHDQISQGCFLYERPIVILIVLTFAALATGFSLGPIFEGSDEIEHYRYIRFLIEEHTLPDPDAQPRGEYHQAPLYYLLAVPFGIGIDHRDFEQIDGRFNPFYGGHIDIPSSDNRNLYLHTRAEAFPYRHSDTARAVHLIRLLSVLLGTGTVIASYTVFRLLWPDRPDRRLLALAVVAFWPQFVFQSSVINNDTLLYLLATIGLGLLLWQLRDGPSWRKAIGLGAVLGALLLTKVSAVFIGLPVALALLFDRRSWRWIPLILAVTATIAGWWYLRSGILYDDPTGTKAVLKTWPGEVIRPGKLALDTGLSRAPYAYQSVWARFGPGTIAVGPAIYRFFDGMVVLTLAGLAAGALIRARRAVHHTFDIAAARQAVVVAAFAAVWIGVLIYWASTAWSGNQGRYLLPGIAGWAAIAAWSWDQLTPRRLRMLTAFAGIGLLAAMPAISLFHYYLPAYRPLPVPKTIARPLSYRFGTVAELIGMAPAQPHADPGDTIRITLYWRALSATETNLQVYLHSVDSDVVRRDSLPGTGNLLSTDWKPGETWAEQYVIAIPRGATPQQVYPLIAGLYDAATGQPLEAFDTQGNPQTPVIGRIAIHGPTWHTQPVYRFGNSIGLEEPRLSRDGDQLEICLRWVSLRQTPVDYHIFVHVLSPDGSLFTQADSQPKNGTYPTGAWMPGEVIDDCITLDGAGLPQTGWQVELGLYNLEDGIRLPVQNSAGQTLPDGRILLAAK